MMIGNLRFFYLSMISVFVFGILYYLQDIFVTKHRDTAIKYGFLERSKLTSTDDREAYPIGAHFWFSLMTQSTVGYGSVNNTITGKHITFFDSPNRLAKVINTLQMMSILFIMSIAG